MNINLLKEKCGAKLSTMSNEQKPSNWNDMYSVNIIWHRRMWHASGWDLEHMAQNPYYGLNGNMNSGEPSCEVCANSKDTKQPSNTVIAEKSKPIKVHLSTRGLFRQKYTEPSALCAIESHAAQVRQCQTHQQSRWGTYGQLKLHLMRKKKRQLKSEKVT